MSVVEQVRSRVRELLERVRTRRLLGQATAPTTGPLIGGGRIIQTVSESIDRVIAMAKERRPNIIPMVLERLRTYEPGAKVRELIVPTTTPPPTERKLLRE